MNRFSFLNRYVFLLFLLLISAHVSAQVLFYKNTSFGLSCQLKTGVINIYLLKDDVAEIKYTSLQNLPAKQSLVVLPVISYLNKFSVTNNDSNLTITTTKFKIIINKNTQAITYTDLQNNIILAETNDFNKVMRDTTVAGIKTYSCGTSFQSAADEGLYGLGCHPLDSLSINYKGRN